MVGRDGREVRPARRWDRGTVALLAVGLAMVAAAAWLILAPMLTQRQYDEQAMASGAQEAAEADGTGGGIDWGALRAQNGDVAAWARVEGTSVDTPVVAPSDGSMTWYLRHDLWGRWSLAGCPFLDSRAGADDMHPMAYGHHLTIGGGMFSDLQPCYRQGEFDRLGDLEWSTPGQGTLGFRPLCATRVDMRDAGSQRFDFQDRQALHDWLRQECARSGAQSGDADVLISQSRRAVSLVTCASLRANQRWRTVVVFVR